MVQIATFRMEILWIMTVVHVNAHDVYRGGRVDFDKLVFAVHNVWAVGPCLARVRLEVFVNTPYHDGNDLSARFSAPGDLQPRTDSSVPVVPPNAYLRSRRGYVPAPVEEAVPSPEMNPGIVYLRERSIEYAEVHAPLDEVVMSHSMAPINGMPKYLGADYLQKWDVKVRAREGTRLKRQLRLWSLLWLCSFVGCLVTAIACRGLLKVGSGPVVLGAGYSSLFGYGLVACSTMLYIRIRNYGFMPWVRLIIITFSSNSDIRDWRDNGDTEGRFARRLREDKRRSV